MIAIALHAGSPEIRNAITNLIVSCKWAYWHWIDDFWIVQAPDSVTPKTLNEAISSLPRANGTTILVFEIKPDFTFWGNAHPDAWIWMSHIGRPSN